MDISQIGEFGLIERLTAAIDADGCDDMIVGPGDDAAVWRLGSEYLIATTDSLVEGVHFLPNRARWEDLGWKAMGTNVSDIAAMGGAPLLAMVTLALPPHTLTRSMDELYQGIAAFCREHNVIVAGGDVVRSPHVVVTVAVIGRAEHKGGEPLLLLRSTARAGDVIAVSGTLGDSAAGLRRLREGAEPDDPLVLRHMRPTPPLQFARSAVQVGVRCGIDISDGLLQDVGQLCEASGVRAVIQSADLPLSVELRQAYRQDALELACTGGEDYELAIAGPRDVVESVPEATIIGEFEDGPPRVTVAGRSGGAVKFERGGWDAFHS